MTSVMPGSGPVFVEGLLCEESDDEILECNMYDSVHFFTLGVHVHAAKVTVLVAVMGSNKRGII